jgi:hypothetical protein
MGKMINNHIKILKSYHNGFTGYVSNIQDSIDVAVDIMRKYQKIQEIIRNYDLTWEFHHMKPTIDKIREVVEDGNDTTNTGNN